MQHGIKRSDVIKSFLALLSIGKNDFEAINGIESEFYFTSAMDIDEIPGEATLRQRMDKYAISFLPIVKKASRDFLSNIQPALRPLSTGHMPGDTNVTPMAQFTWVRKATVSALNFVKINNTARKT